MGQNTKDNPNLPEAWLRFERAVDAAIKSGPKHREAKKPVKKGKTKRRASSSKRAKP